MADAKLSEVMRFFKTGNPERDRAANFNKEWKALSETEQQEIRTLVGAELS